MASTHVSTDKHRYAVIPSLRASLFLTNVHTRVLRGGCKHSTSCIVNVLTASDAAHDPSRSRPRTCGGAARGMTDLQPFRMQTCHRVHRVMTQLLKCP
jgi:hypothetical protein